MNTILDTLIGMAIASFFFFLLYNGIKSFLTLDFLSRRKAVLEASQLVGMFILFLAVGTAARGEMQEAVYIHKDEEKRIYYTTSASSEKVYLNRDEKFPVGWGNLPLLARCFTPLINKERAVTDTIIWLLPIYDSLFGDGTTALFQSLNTIIACSKKSGAGVKGG